MKRYSDTELKAFALQFYHENKRPPRMREHPYWRTIITQWERHGGWNGFLREINMKTYEQWEYDQNISALANVLEQHGEVTRRAYNQLVGQKKATGLPDILTINRVLGTCELGKEGRVWQIVREKGR